MNDIMRLESFEIFQIIPPLLQKDIEDELEPGCQRLIGSRKTLCKRKQLMLLEFNKVVLS